MKIHTQLYASLICRLDPQANMWLEGGRFKGEMEEIVWDEDGDQMRLPTRPATWSAPPKNSSTHRSGPFWCWMMQCCVLSRLTAKLTLVLVLARHVLRSVTEDRASCVCVE